MYPQNLQLSNCPISLGCVTTTPDSAPQSLGHRPQCQDLSQEVGRSLDEFGGSTWFDMGLSENSVPLNPMVNDHYPY